MIFELTGGFDIVDEESWAVTLTTDGSEFTYGSVVSNFELGGCS